MARSQGADARQTLEFIRLGLDRDADLSGVPWPRRTTIRLCRDRHGRRCDHREYRPHHPQEKRSPAMKWPAWYSRFARDPQFQRAVMRLLMLQIVWATMDLLFSF